AFLRGATEPPPKSWFFKAETWKEKKNALALKVPEGARQLVVFLVPESGGFDAVVSAVRKQPGAFVRAVQDLDQASLDRARLDAFLDGIHALERTRPERIEAVSPLLSRSLAIKLKAECLDLAADLQASCLTQSRDSLVLADGQSSTLADTLVGAPTDLALQLSATPEGGLGYYSPYIGVVRDLAKIFGAFQSTQFRYIPALARAHDDRLALLLNAAPSFASPKSVMVVAMPVIETGAPQTPTMRRAEADRLVCAARPDLVLPVEGAPLIYATKFAHDMMLRVTTPQGDSVFRASVAPTQRIGELFVPIHWTDRTATGGRTGLLPRPLADPISGQPGFKSTPVRIEPVATEWRGFVVVRGELVSRPDCLWATRVAVPGGTAWDMAGNGDAD
ncbi:molybdopterin dinucleotide binding domain-containing protein, partial [Sphingomonas sp. RB3P16]|uniref:molybdopterin dinucleotide binding domain-containing protein n=1 Tax=Parasphingomonas frigoris TaxID=3096163 RepID=UPI002FC65716